MTSWLQNNSEQKHNICIAVPSTPAQYFHLLRRQIHRPFAKPLVAMTGKWLHIHSACASELAELGPGTFFRRLIVEGHDGDNMKERTKQKLGLNEPTEIKRVIFCTGQVSRPYSNYFAKLQSPVTTKVNFASDILSHVPSKSCPQD